MTPTELYELVKPLWAKVPELRPSGLASPGKYGVDCFAHFRHGKVYRERNAAALIRDACVRWLLQQDHEVGRVNGKFYVNIWLPNQNDPGTIEDTDLTTVLVNACLAVAAEKKL